MSTAAFMRQEVVGANPDVSVLIADDHWVVRESLKHIARGLCGEGDIEEASTLDEALAVLDRNPGIDLVIMDLMMPGAHEFDGLRDMRSRFPALPVIVVSVHEDAEHVLEAINHGAVGYIPKSYSAAQIKQAFKLVLAGEVSFPREILTRRQVAPQRPVMPTPVTSARELTVIPDSLATLATLTRREIEIMAALGRGEPLNHIAETLAISRQTVRVHLGNAMKKLGTPAREALIRLAVENSTWLERALRFK